MTKFRSEKSELDDVSLIKEILNTFDQFAYICMLGNVACFFSSSDFFQKKFDFYFQAKSTTYK